jgi:poly-gamma-glutamate synthesis protein (capsule biosynthesis protein)
MLGTAASRREVYSVEVKPEPGPDELRFGSFFEGWLQFERGKTAHVRAFVNEDDCRAIVEHVRDAANRAEYVLVSLHTHEGTDDNWYSPRPPSFVEDFAHQVIDAGATAFVGHGAHMLRGVEVYRGRPIFYNLGSVVMEFEAGEQLMTPEMYAAYGFGKDALPSHLHRSRVHDKDGNRVGFYGHPRFSRNCMALCDFEPDGVRFRLLPLDLDLNRARVSERGLPYVATAEEGRAITADLQRMSDVYGTKLSYDEADGTIAVTAG